MEPNKNAGKAARSGVATYVVEAVVAFCVLTLGVVVITGSRSLGSGWTTDGPGAGYFPFYIGVILCIAGLGIMYQALFGKNKNTDIFVDNEQLKLGGGYDHNFILDRKDADLMLAARVEEPTTGRVMEVLTTEPGIQLYIGNFLPKTDDPSNPMTGKSGKKYTYRGGFCLETQHYPDSPNQPKFPSTVLKPGEVFASTTVYRFSTK